MADPATLAAAGTLLGGVASVAGVVMRPDAPEPPKPVTPDLPDPETAQRTAQDRQRSRLRSLALGGEQSTQRTGATGLPGSREDEDGTGRRRRTTILGR